MSERPLRIQRKHIIQLVMLNYGIVLHVIDTNDSLDTRIPLNFSPRVVEDVVNSQMYVPVVADECFAMLVKSTSVPTRWVWNSEDHVWVEYFSRRQGRWIHLDPCENAYDDPLLYART